MRMCVWKHTPAAGTGEAEPAGTGESWRQDELACSLSHNGLDRNGLCRRPEPRHTEPPNNAPHKRMKMTGEKKKDCPQRSRGRCRDWDSVKCKGRKSGGKIQATRRNIKAEGSGGPYLAGDCEGQHRNHWEVLPALSVWTCLWGLQHAGRWGKLPPATAVQNNYDK